jgi:hypothetical protein
MKIRTEPLLGGAAFCFVILLIINIISVFVTMNSMQQTMEALMVSLNDPMAPAPSMFSSPMMSILGCLSCLAPLIAGIGAGVIYARQYAKIEPITGSLVSGGAASGALGFFLSGIVGGIVGGIMVIPIMNQMSSLDPSLAGTMGPAMGAGVAGGIMGGICFGFIYALIGAILGAIGAAVGVPKSAKAA